MIQKLNVNEQTTVNLDGNGGLASGRSAVAFWWQFHAEISKTWESYSWVKILILLMAKSMTLIWNAMSALALTSIICCYVCWIKAFNRALIVLKIVNLHIFVKFFLPNQDSTLPVHKSENWVVWQFGRKLAWNFRRKRFARAQSTALIHEGYYLEELVSSTAKGHYLA